MRCTIFAKLWRPISPLADLTTKRAASFLYCLCIWATMVSLEWTKVGKDMHCTASVHWNVRQNANFTIFARPYIWQRPNYSSTVFAYLRSSLPVVFMSSIYFTQEAKLIELDRAQVGHFVHFRSYIFTLFRTFSLYRNKAKMWFGSIAWFWACRLTKITMCVSWICFQPSSVARQKMRPKRMHAASPSIFPFPVLQCSRRNKLWETENYLEKQRSGAPLSCSFLRHHLCSDAQRTNNLMEQNFVSTFLTQFSQLRYVQSQQ